MNFKRFGLKQSLPSSHSSLTKVKGTIEPSGCVCKQVWNKPLLRLRQDTLQLNSQSLVQSPLWTQRGVATQFLQWSRNDTYSILLRKDHCSYYQRYEFEVKVRSWEGVRHPRLPNPKVGFPLIVSYVLTLLKACSTLLSNSHTHQQTSKHTTWHQSSLTIHLSCSLTKAKHSSNQATHQVIDPNIHLAWHFLTYMSTNLAFIQHGMT